MRSAAAWACAALWLLPAEARADELEERIAFLETRITAQRDHAEIWWKGWTTFYAFGAVVQGIRASGATDPAERADLWVSFVKATGAFTRFVFDPHAGIRGLDPPPTFSSSPGVRLARAEQLLEHNAKRTNAFGPWYAHLINFGLNGTGAVIVGAGFDDWSQGLISAAIGFAIGEIVILSGPWEADDDLADYTLRF